MNWTPDRIQSKLMELRFKPILTKSEVKNLWKILNPNEDILAIVEGLLKKIHNRTVGGHGVAILTDKRVIFYRKSIIGTETKEEIPRDRISSASLRKGILHASISIISSSNDAEIDQCDKEQAQFFCDAVTRVTSTSQNHLIISEDKNSARDDRIGQLERLGKLRDSGVLTQDEFESEKVRLLNT